MNVLRKSDSGLGICFKNFTAVACRPFRQNVSCQPLNMLPVSPFWNFHRAVSASRILPPYQRALTVTAIGAAAFGAAASGIPRRPCTVTIHRFKIVTALKLLQECYRCHRFKNVSGTTALTLLPVVRSKAIIITVALIPQYFLTASGMLPLRRLQARCRCQTLSPLVRGDRCYRYHRFKILPLYLCVFLCCYARHRFELADIVAALSITNVTASRL